MMDRLMLMVEGHIVYQGRASKSTHYFSSLNYPCPVYANPADYFIKILNISGKNVAQNQERIDYFVDCYFKNNYPHILFEIQSLSQKEGKHEKKIEELKHNPHKLAQYHE